MAKSKKALRRRRCRRAKRTAKTPKLARLRAFVQDESAEAEAAEAADGEPLSVDAKPKAKAKAKSSPKSTAKPKGKAKAKASAKSTAGKPKAKATAKAKASAKSTAAKPKASPKSAGRPKAKAKAKASPIPVASMENPLKKKRAPRGDDGTAPNQDVVDKLLKVMNDHGQCYYEDSGLELHNQDWLPSVRLNVYWTRDAVGVSLRLPGKPSEDVAHFGGHTPTIASNLVLGRLLATYQQKRLESVVFVYFLCHTNAAQEQEMYNDNEFAHAPEGQAYIRILKASMRKAWEVYNSQ